MAEDEEKRRDEAASGDTQAILAEIRETTQDDSTAMNEAHQQAQKNIKFLNLDQWDPTALAQKKKNDKPTLIFPKLTQYHDSVYGSMLQKRPSITVTPDDKLASGAKMSLQSKKRIAGAAGFAGMMRQIDAINYAHSHYLAGYEGAIGWGFGHWRYLVDYAPYSFDKVILIEPIHDPFSVLWDHASTRMDNDDATRCTITSEMPKKSFEAQYKGAKAADWTASDTSVPHLGNWIKANIIVVAERFAKEPVDKVICELSDGRVVEWDDDTVKIKDELEQMQVTVARERRAKGYKIVWYKASGLDILDGPLDMDGQFIPVVTCWGRRLWVEGKWTLRSLTQPAHDEQRAYNYARSKMIEATALAPMVPYVVGASQLEGFEHIWDNLNSGDYAYAPFNDKTNPNRPSRESPGIDLSGLRDVVLMSQEGLMSSIGRYEASQGMRSNERSGRALLARDQQGERNTEPFDENYRVALNRGGQIVMDLVPKVYQPGRMAQILNEDLTSDAVLIGREVIQDEQTGEQVVLNDLTFGRYSCKITMAPEFSTMRQESVTKMTDFATAFPETAAIIGPEVLANMDIPGNDRMARMARAGLPPEIRQAAEEDEDQEMPPQAKAAIEQAQATMQEAEALVQGAQKQMDDLTQERDRLKLGVEALRVKIEQAKADSDREQDELKLKYERQLLTLEKRLFTIEQKAAANNFDRGLDDARREKEDSDEPVAA